MLTSSAAGLIRKLEGDFENILVRDPKTRVAAHIQIPTGENARRVVVAMPAGKSALCFETTRSVGWTLDDNVVSFAEENGQGGGNHGGTFPSERPVANFIGQAAAFLWVKDRVECFP